MKDPAIKTTNDEAELYSYHDFSKFKSKCIYKLYEHEYPLKFPLEVVLPLYRVGEINSEDSGIEDNQIVGTFPQLNQNLMRGFPLPWSKCGPRLSLLRTSGWAEVGIVCHNCHSKRTKMWFWQVIIKRKDMRIWHAKCFVASIAGQRALAEPWAYKSPTVLIHADKSIDWFAEYDCHCDSIHDYCRGVQCPDMDYQRK